MEGFVHKSINQNASTFCAHPFWFAERISFVQEYQIQGSKMSQVLGARKRLFSGDGKESDFR